METRDEEMRKMMQMEEERLQMVLDEYKQRYDRERERLQEALVKAANCAQVVSDGLAESLGLERQLFGYRFGHLSPRYNHQSNFCPCQHPSCARGLRETCPMLGDARVLT